MILNEPVNVADKSEGKADGDSEQRLSYSDAAAAFNVVPCYLEQHSTLTPAETIFLEALA